MIGVKCVFCSLGSDRIVGDYQKFIVIRDLYPVTHLHSLIIPKRHAVSYFDLESSEIEELPVVISTLKNELLSMDPTISGFNIGINEGESAGQTVFHCHVHVIPRRTGDIKDSRGGVRGGNSR